VSVANAVVDDVAELLNGGSVLIFDGSMPNVPDDPVRGQTLLAVLPFPDPAFSIASQGRANAQTRMTDPDARATGTATWFRAIARDGTVIYYGSVGVAGADLNLDDVNIERHAVVEASFILRAA
jgi:hypothetical protein